MNECYFLDCEGNGSPSDYPFVNLISNSLETKDVKSSTVSATNVQADSMTTLVNGNYQIMPYQACESMSGAIYALPIPVINTYGGFKGPFYGAGGSSIAGGTYEIAVDLTITTAVAGSIDMYCQIGTSNLGSISLAIPIGTALMHFRVPFYVQAGSATNVSIQYYSTLETFGGTFAQARNTGGAITVLGLSLGVISPTFFIRANIAPASWSSERRGYLFRRLA